MHYEKMGLVYIAYECYILFLFIAHHITRIGMSGDGNTLTLHVLSHFIHRFFKLTYFMTLESFCADFVEYDFIRGVSEKYSTDGYINKN